MTFVIGHKITLVTHNVFDVHVNIHVSVELLFIGETFATNATIVVENLFMFGSFMCFKISENIKIFRKVVFSTDYKYLFSDHIDLFRVPV